MNTEGILAGLTEPQREAVMHRDGPLLVLAGPGSGKTRVITRRAAYLAATGIWPRQILAITFTNKAAEEMAHRMAELGVGPEMTVCTFHSLCARLLRRFGDRAGISTNFSIFDQSDRISAIKSAITMAGLREDNFSPAKTEHKISRYKNAMIGPDEAEAKAEGFDQRAVARIYKMYEAVLAEQCALDFDDLLLRMARLLGDDSDIREQLENQYRYVLVDEYQDTNHAQYLIARGLALKNHNLCVTGDPDQSIYGWRGANLGNILDFEEDFPEAKVVRLEQNYRSTQHILAAADRVISRNRKRKRKKLWTENAEGNRVRVAEHEDAGAEADWIAGELSRLAEAGVSYQQSAVFYRINALTRRLEQSLRTKNVPYRIIRGVEFYNRKEIKDVIAYLRVLINPADEVSLVRIINTPPRGIGATTVERLEGQVRETGLPMSHWVQHAEEVPDIPRATLPKLNKFAKMIEMLRPVIHGSARDAVENVLKLSGYAEALRKEKEEDHEGTSTENVNELITAAAEFDEMHPDGTLIEWIQQVSLTSDQDAYDPSVGAVTLMTLHAAKGLEFNNVFIVGCEEGILPHQQRQDSQADVEEERRLFFVGMTRAKERLTLSHSRYREIRGMTQRMGPSMFLKELPEENVEEIRLVGTQSEDSWDEPQRYDDDGQEWREGQLVRHPSYGLGRLLWIQRSPFRTRAGVNFTSYGQKVLILEYCKLERVHNDD